jgi:hypothetical protein
VPHSRIAMFVQVTAMDTDTDIHIDADSDAFELVMSQLEVLLPIITIDKHELMSRLLLKRPKCHRATSLTCDHYKHYNHDSNSQILDKLDMEMKDFVGASRLWLQLE